MVVDGFVAMHSIGLTAFTIKSRAHFGSRLKKGIAIMNVHTGNQGKRPPRSFVETMGYLPKQRNHTSHNLLQLAGCKFTAAEINRLEDACSPLSVTTAVGIFLKGLASGDLIFKPED
jgi:hypothetical protein